MIKNLEISIASKPRGFHLVTNELERLIQKQLPHEGLVHFFLKHTSAGLTINENADPTVRDDFNNFIDKLIPENDTLYTHTAEGPDDMPAHIKSSLIGNELTVPVKDGQLMLGTWQGIYLCEFRNHAGNRKVFITIYS